MFFCSEKSIKVFGAGLAAALALCSGCGPEHSYKETKDHYVVGAVIKSDSSEYWMSVISGMEAAAAAYDMEVVTMAPDSELDLKVQEKQIEKLIQQQVDALAISPIDSTQTPDYLEMIEENGITAVTFDTGFESENLPYIGIDNYQVGYELAKKLAEKMNHRGKTGIVAGDLKQNGHSERVRGFQDYIVQEPQMEVAFVESGYANRLMSEQEVQELIGENSGVMGILATSAVTGLGLADELKGSGILIATVDEQEDSLEALENGEIAVLAAQSGYDIGYQTISYIDQQRKGEETQENVYLETEILTADNVEAYRETE